MALTLQQCGFWFVGVGLLTRREVGKNKDGLPTYSGDLACGVSRQFIKLTPEQYGMIPPEGLEARVQGNIKEGKDGMYLQTTTVEPFAQTAPSGRPRV